MNVTYISLKIIAVMMSCLVVSGKVLVTHLNEESANANVSTVGVESSASNHTAGIGIPSSCTFPFQYEGEWYSGCITKGKGRPWCSIDEIYTQFNGDQSRWKYCDDLSVKQVSTFSGYNCSFPFTYGSNKFYGCITLGHPRHKSWCLALDSWGHQKADLCVEKRNLQIDTFGGTSNGSPCAFPFMLFTTKKTYHGCTNDGRTDGKFFCAVRLPSGKSGWGFCNAIDTMERTNEVIKGYSKAWLRSTCVFPFKYEGRMNHGCIGDAPWCATTGDYDTDKKWKYCYSREIVTTSDFNYKYNYDQNITLQECSFPYVNNGVLVNTDMIVDGYRYCSTTYNYDTDKKRIRSGRRTNGYGGGNRQCYFPFTNIVWHRKKGTATIVYDRNVHHGCVSGKYSYWCATTSEFRGGTNWKKCAYY